MEIKWAQNIQILETGWSIFFETTFLQELQMIKDAVKCGWYSHIQFYVYFNYRWEVYHYLSFFWILLPWHIMPDKLESSNSWQVIYIYILFCVLCVLKDACVFGLAEAFCQNIHLLECQLTLSVPLNKP